MIVPESLGHTFGLSIAEFQSFNKPVICFNTPYLYNTAHVDILNSNGIYFRDESEFINRVLGISKGDQSVNSYAEYTPKNVMKKFQQVFIQGL
jgi:hypothetical protein